MAVSFLNPLNASSQRIQFGPTLQNLQPYTVPVRVVVTDSQGHVSGQDATATMTRDNQ